MTKSRIWWCVLTISFVAAGGTLMLRPTHVAIRSTRPIQTSFVESLATPFPVRVLTRNSSSDAALVEMPMIARPLFDRRAARRMDSTFLIHLGNRSDTLIRELDAANSSPAARAALAAAVGATGVSAASLVRIDDANSIFELLSAALNTSHASLQDLFGVDCEIESAEFLNGRSNELALTLRSSQGVPGSMYIYEKAGTFDTHLKMGALDIDVTPVGDGEYLRVRRAFQGFPLEGDSTSYLQDGRPAQTTKTAAREDPSTQSAYLANVTLAIGFTSEGSRAYAKQMRPQATGESADDIVDELVRRQVTEDNRRAFGGAAGTGSFAIQAVIKHLSHPDNITAPSSLSLFCSSPRTETSRGARELYLHMLDNEVDVGVLVVDGLCADKSGLIKDDIDCDGRPAPMPCDSLPDKRDICGLAASIGPSIDRAFVVIEATCLANSTLHHELGHILGAQHVNGSDEVGTASARAKIETDRALARTWITLTGSSEDCRKFRDETGDQRECYREIVYSDPDRIIVSDALVGPALARAAGSSERNNAAQIRKSFPIVSGFGEQRNIERCKKLAEAYEISFQFNSPRVRDIVNWQFEPVVADDLQLQQMGQAAAHAVSFLRSCSFATVRVSGHTDDVRGPDPTYNDRLSLARAQFVHAAILKELEGNSRSRLCPPEGMGAREPVSPGSSDAARSRNRRAVVQLSLARCEEPTQARG